MCDPARSPGAPPEGRDKTVGHPLRLGAGAGPGGAGGFSVSRSAPLHRELSGDERGEPAGDCRGVGAQDVADGAALCPSLGGAYGGGGGAHSGTVFGVEPEEEIG